MYQRLVRVSDRRIVDVDGRVVLLCPLEFLPLLFGYSPLTVLSRLDILLGAGSDGYTSSFYWASSNSPQNGRVAVQPSLTSPFRPAC